MLRDITLGQFFPGESIVHKTDPRLKIIILITYITALFIIDNPVSYLLLGVVVISTIAISGISFRVIIKGLKPLLFIVCFTAVLNIFYTPGDVVWSFWFLSVTAEGIEVAIFMVIRIILLVTGSSILTYTTSPVMLTDALESLFKPLKKLKVPVHELALMMTIALRFIPTLIEETDKIMSSQRARGADFESGSLMQRAKALIPILIPLFISAFRRADELAIAMECRLYRGDEGRTKLKALKFCYIDVISLMICGIITLMLYFIELYTISEIINFVISLI